MNINKLHEFVKQTCAGRDPSHGYDHMATVTRLTLEIMTNEGLTCNPELFIVVALLHDVNDHKYDHDGRLEQKIRIFLKQYYREERIDLVMSIIDRISYSKENRFRQKHSRPPRQEWKKELGEVGLLIRDIVSDADKLEALGETGYFRCVEYTREKNPEASQEEINHLVEKHYDEKLSRLVDEFMVTDYAKKLGRERLEELKCLVFS